MTHHLFGFLLVACCCAAVVAAPMSATTSVGVAPVKLRTPTHRNAIPVPEPELAEYNFGPASSRDDVFHAAELPGLKHSDEEPKPGSIGEEDVKEWIRFMKAHRVQRVVTLLDHDEAAWYAAPGLVEMCKEHFKVVENVPMRAWDARDRIKEHMRTASIRGERTVFVCSDGQGRSSRVLAASLVLRYGLCPHVATQEVLTHSKRCNTERKGDGMMLARFLEVGYESWRMQSLTQVRFNFAKASTRDDIVHGAQAPGMNLDDERPTRGSIEEEDVVEWIRYMAAHGVQRVVSLLSAEEAERFAAPGLDGMCKDHFRLFERVDMQAPGAWGRVLGSLQAAEAAGEKVVVVCADGKDRSARALAAWLVERHGFSVNGASAAIAAAAEDAGVHRKGDVQKLARMLEKGRESWLDLAPPAQ